MLVRPAAAITSTIVLIGLALWLALPAVALAHNCPSLAGGEVGDCLKKNFDASLALIGAGLGAIGAAASWYGNKLSSGDTMFGWPLPPMPPPLPDQPPPLTPGQPPPKGPPQRLPGGFYDPRTGEPWSTDSRRPYPRDPNTGEPLDPNDS